MSGGAATVTAPGAVDWSPRLPVNSPIISAGRRESMVMRIGERPTDLQVRRVPATAEARAGCGKAA